jgi:hypothetical protein
MPNFETIKLYDNLYDLTYQNKNFMITYFYNHNLNDLIALKMIELFNRLYI